MDNQKVQKYDSIIKLSLDEQELLIVNKIKIGTQEPDFSNLEEITENTGVFQM
jgi:hypothetical protein